MFMVVNNAVKVCEETALHKLSYFGYAYYSSCRLDGQYGGSGYHDQQHAQLLVEIDQGNCIAGIVDRSAHGSVVRLRGA